MKKKSGKHKHLRNLVPAYTHSQHCVSFLSKEKQQSLFPSTSHFLFLPQKHHFPFSLYNFMAFLENPFSLYISIFIFFCFCNKASTKTIPPSTSSDVELLLLKIKPLLQGNTENLVLSSWNTSIPLCQWRGLKWVFTNDSSLSCNDLSSPQWNNLLFFKDPFLHLLSLQLPSANLSGSLPREIGQFPMLKSLYLNINSLSGTIPLELGYGSSLDDIDLSDNLLSGVLPPSIWNLCDKLVSLKIHGNLLSGSVSEPALPDSSCKFLQFLDLGGNKFSGNFPDFVTNFGALKQLDLGNNMFSGAISEGLVGLRLEKLNLSHNNFSGVVPFFGESKFGVDAFEGNSPDLCGSPLQSCSKKNSSLSSGAVAGIVISLMTGAVVLASLLIGYMQNKKKKGSGESEDELNDDEEDEENGGGNSVGGNGGEGKLMLFPGGENLTLDDVLNATGQVMEKTCYGTAYKAKLADGGTIALRLLREGTCKDRGSCLAVIKQLGKIRHENLIPLRAFYQGKRGEKLLIYDYLPLRTLHDLLHGSFNTEHSPYAFFRLLLMYMFRSHAYINCFSYL
jgi:hypothetical protein